MKLFEKGIFLYFLYTMMMMKKMDKKFIQMLKVRKIRGKSSFETKRYKNNKEFLYFT